MIYVFALKRDTVCPQKAIGKIIFLLYPGAHHFGKQTK